jgi:hypothetical protein
MLLVTAVVLTGGAHAAADQVPTFDVTPSCQAAAKRANAPNYASACLRDEKQARAKLQQNWQEYTVEDRRQCRALSSLGGMPTYTEILTCIELAREARQLRAHPAPSTTGSGTPAPTR